MPDFIQHLEQRLAQIAFLFDHDASNAAHVASGSRWQTAYSKWQIITCYAKRPSAAQSGYLLSAICHLPYAIC
jgi:hypothetical protein